MEEVLPGEGYRMLGACFDRRKRPPYCRMVHNRRTALHLPLLALGRQYAYSGPGAMVQSTEWLTRAQRNCLSQRAAQRPLCLSLETVFAPYDRLPELCYGPCAARETSQICLCASPAPGALAHLLRFLPQQRFQHAHDREL